MTDLNAEQITIEVTKRLSRASARHARREAMRGKRWPMLSQLVGAAGVVAAIVMLAGVAWGVGAAGVGLIAVGALREAGLI